MSDERAPLRPLRIPQGIRDDMPDLPKGSFGQLSCCKRLFAIDRDTGELHEFPALGELLQAIDAAKIAHARADAAYDLALAIGNGTGSSAILGTTLPIGFIAIWSGTVASIPQGFQLCDGTNGTPDLRDRFVVGAGSKYTTGDTGGADSVALSVAQMPSHSHNVNINLRETTGYSGAYTNSGASGTVGPPATVGSAGSNQAHENRPPYYALCYIMKTSEPPEFTIATVAEAQAGVLPTVRAWTPERVRQAAEAAISRNYVGWNEFIRNGVDLDILSAIGRI